LDYQVKFEVNNRPVNIALLLRQVEQATGLNLSDERPGKERDGGIEARGPEMPISGGGFPVLTEITVATARPLTSVEEGALRAVIAAHSPARLVARPPDYAAIVQDRLSAQGVDALVAGDPLSGFGVTLQGPVTAGIRLALKNAVSEWDMQVAE
jgi:hypothetical protein